MAEWDGTPPGPECGMSAPDSGAGLDESVRPRSLDDFIGQDELRANLRVYLDAARERGKALDHTLFYGNPGLGKTTLARSWLPNWASIWSAPPGRCWNAAAIWRPF